MGKARNATLWTEEGYNLFAKEGLDGIQVERLARILQLNKSGFYHYFGDLEGYSAELIKMHMVKAGIFLQNVHGLKKIDPDYLHLLIDHGSTVMFQVQLTRHKENYSLYEAGEKVDQLMNLALRSLWNEFLGITANPDLAMRYFYLVRDMFYTRISFPNLNYEFLHNFVTEAKTLIDQIAELKSQGPVRSLR